MLWRESHVVDVPVAHALNNLCLVYFCRPFRYEINGAFVCQCESVDRVEFSQWLQRVP